METLGEGEGEVNLVAWPGYVEDGSTDPKVDWVTGFEKDSGCKVNVKVGNTSDEMVTLMRTGRYDGVSASGDASLRLIAGGDVAPVNTELIPSYAEIFDGAQGPAVELRRRRSPTASRTAAAPTCSSTGPTRSSRRPTRGASCGTRTRPTRARSRPTTAPIYIADAALYLKATQPDLGITNPYELDQKQFDAAVALLKKQKRDHRRVLV